MNVPTTQALDPELAAGPDFAELGRSRDGAPGVFLMTNSFETGGSERQFVELARALQPRNYRVTLGCLQENGPLRIDLGQVQHFDLGGSLYRPRSMRARYRLAAYLRRNKVAVAHAFDFYTNLALIPAAKMARTPVVIGSQRQLGDLLSSSQRRAQLAMFRWADCVVCNSRAAADRLIQQGLSPAQAVVIGNGLPSAAFADAVRIEPRRPGTFRVGMIARMNAGSKNHRIVLEVGARLRHRLPGFEIVFVGDGPLRTELEHQAEQLGIRGQVQFLGERRDIPAILASLDVTVLPSASESLSNAILESMAAGVPVIAKAVGGNVELLSQGRGILIPPNDGDALEAALLQMSANAPMRDQVGRIARRFAEENFTIEQMRRKHEELYAELLERKLWKMPLTRNRSIPAQKPLRVAIVAASLRYVGGQSVQADLLQKNWQSDADVHAEFIPIDPQFPRGLQWVERVPGLRTVVREPLYLLALWRGLKNADIAHVFSASYWSFLLAPVPAWWIARMRRKKLLLHYHSGEARDHLRRFGTARSMLARMGMLVVPSAYLVDVFEEFGLKAKVIPNIVDLSQFRFRSRAPLRPHLVCTRGFHPYYRVDLIVRAFAQVQKVFPEACLDLAGAGPVEKEIRDLVDELKLTGVRFLGAVPRAEIGRVYDEADIFVNASSLDNMPVSILEAFASGTPVVSTAPEGMRYLVDHERTGLLSEPGEAAPLAENILRLLRDEELSSRLAANGFEELRRYRWAAVRESWLAAYRTLMQEHSETGIKAGEEGC
ncbi:MAG TPA: glycosyltransferase [Candidatus Sulfotelmatobacter sp.]|jgi:glycosyltransferase involved in cell wall biosynthesis|nr:glycosyltransferase [Candidatus Sulfotelmatobacter sp.]